MYKHINAYVEIERSLLLYIERLSPWRTAYPAVRLTVHVSVILVSCKPRVISCKVGYGFAYSLPRFFFLLCMRKYALVKHWFICNALDSSNPERYTVVHVLKDL